MSPDLLTSIQVSLATNPTYALVFWLLVLGIIAFIGMEVTRFILHRVYLVSHAMEKKVYQIRVPKEGAKKEEEEKSSKKDYKELIAVMDAFYTALGHVRSRNRFKAYFFGREDHVSLEMVSVDGLIKFYAVVPRFLVQFFQQQLHAQYPSATIVDMEDFNLFRPKGAIFSAPILVSKDSIFPFKTYKKMESDPLNGLTNALAKVEKNQTAMIQLLVRTAPHGWGERGHHLARRMQQGKGVQELQHNIWKKIAHTIIVEIGAVFSSRSSQQQQQSNQTPAHMYKHSPLEQELIKALDEKCGKTGFEVNMRVVTCADQPHVAKMHLYNIVHAFGQYSGPESGISFAKQRFFSKRRLLKSVIYRSFSQRKKHKILLSSEELASIFHLPLSTTETPNIEWLKARTAPPPHNVPREGILLGESVFRGKRIPIRMLRDDRRRHMYIIGTTGTGKSTIMVNMMIQDIKNGEGCCLIDPHGEAVEAILRNIPPERADDVILFDPGDTERPMGLNMLEVHGEAEKDFATGEMISIFYKLVSDPSMIGPMFEHYMRNAMLTLMSDINNPNTIVEIPRILTDKEFQKFQLKHVTDPIIRAFWEKELPQTSGQTKGEMLPYLVSKIGAFIENTMMRNIIGQPRSSFDFSDIMNNQKIFLANLSKGKIGEMNMKLLGMILVTKLQMAAFERVNIPQDQRKDFFLYMDEFQNFITDSIATILSEARKYKLNLVMAHQYVAQLSPKQGDTKVRDAVFGNVGTLAVYRVGVDDAEMIAKQLAPTFNEFDVMNVEAYTAYVKLMVKNEQARPFSMKVPKDPDGDMKIAEAIKQLSRYKFGRDKAIVEAEIFEKSKLGGEDEKDDDWDI